MTNKPTKIVALAGGVGGAKLASGLAAIMPPENLTVVVNTADDFTMFGLRICPDLDTVMYTLAGRANPHTGWGVAGDTFNGMAMLADYGATDGWFNIGDYDFATHILRTQRLRDAGLTLTDVTAELATSIGVQSRILPMCNEVVRTVIDTPSGKLNFQVYFVQRQQQDTVDGVEFFNIQQARVTPEVRQAVLGARVIILCPSNPIVSIGPILAVPAMRELLLEAPAPKIAVSPLIGGKALKGPADKMMQTLGHEVSAYGVARLYAGIANGMVIDHADAEQDDQINALGMEVLTTNAVMQDEPDRARFAREVLDFALQVRHNSLSSP